MCGIFYVEEFRYLVLYNYVLLFLFIFCYVVCSVLRRCVNFKGVEIGMSDKRGSKFVKRRSWLDLFNCMCILLVFDMIMIDYVGDVK